jgi:hypothetical protein
VAFVEQDGQQAAADKPCPAGDGDSHTPWLRNSGKL